MVVISPQHTTRGYSSNWKEMIKILSLVMLAILHDNYKATALKVIFFHRHFIIHSLIPPTHTPPLSQYLEFYTNKSLLVHNVHDDKFDNQTNRLFSCPLLTSCHGDGFGVMVTLVTEK